MLIREAAPRRGLHQRWTFEPLISWPQSGYELLGAIHPPISSTDLEAAG